MRPLSRLLLASLTTLALIAGACASQQKTDDSTTPAGGGDGRQAVSTIEDVPHEGGPTGPEFKPYDAPEGFSVALPAEPQIARKEVPLGSSRVTTAAYSARAMDVLYSVSIADYPEKLVASRPPEALLNEGRDGLVKELNGTLKDEQDITVEGYPGKSYTVSSQTVGELRARNILVGPRMYTLLVLYSPNTGAPAAESFLTSLKLVNPPPPAGHGGAGRGHADGRGHDRHGHRRGHGRAGRGHHRPASPQDEVVAGPRCALLREPGSVARWVYVHHSSSGGVDPPVPASAGLLPRFASLPSEAGSDGGESR